MSMRGGIYRSRFIAPQAQPALATLSKSVNVYTLAAAAGSHALSGNTVAVKLGRMVTATGGTYALGGAVASLKPARKLAATNGSYALSGSAATLARLIAAANPPVYHSFASTSYASRTLETVCDAPAGVTDGDILIAGVFAGAGGGSIADAASIEITPPGGWTQIGTDTEVYSAGFAGTFQVFWKRASGEGADYTFAHSGPFTICSTQAVIVAYSHCVATGDPIDQFSQNSSSAGSVATATGLTTTLINSKLVYAGHNWTGSGTLTPPTGMTERFDGIVYFSDESRPAAGATSNRTQTQAAYAPWAAFLVALKPEMLTLEWGLIRATGGSYALTGRTASLVKGRIIVAAAGSHALSGTAATLKPSSYRTAVLPGSYALLGATAPLIWSGETRVPPVFRAVASTTYGARTDTTIAKPTGTVDGDILLCAIVLVKSPTAPGAVTPPAGWLEIDAATLVHDSVNTFAAFSVFWKRASGEPSSYTFSHAAASTQAEILAYSGCVPLGTPFDDYSVTSGNTNNDHYEDLSGNFWVDYTTITTRTIATKLILLSHNWDGTGALTPPGLTPGGSPVMTERYDSLVYAADEDWGNAGPTGRRAMRHPSANPFAGLLLALRPSTATPIYEVTGLAGSYGITGVDAAIEHGLIVLPGSYTLTGAVANLYWPSVPLFPPGSGQRDGGAVGGARKRKRAKIFYIITQEAKKVVERPGPLRKKRKKLAKIIAEEVLPEAGGLLAADQLLLELMIRRQLEQIPLGETHTAAWPRLQEMLMQVITDAEQTAQRLRAEAEEEDDLLLLLTS